MNNTTVREHVTHFENNTRMNKNKNKSNRGRSRKKDKKLDSSFETLPVVIGEESRRKSTAGEEQLSTNKNISFTGRARSFSAADQLVDSPELFSGKERERRGWGTQEKI